MQQYDPVTWREQARWTAAAAGAILPAFVLAGTAGFDFVFAVIASLPAVLFLLLSRRPAPPSAIFVGMAALTAYVVLYIGSAPSYDTSSTGAIIFVTNPLAGLAAVGLSVSITAGVSRARRKRQ